MYKIINSIKLSFLLFIFFFLFVSFKYIQYPLVGLILLSLFTIKYKNIKIQELKYTLPIIIIFFINSISLIYSNNILAGLGTIETQLSLLLLPIIICFDKEFYNKNKFKIINLFIFAAIIGVVILIIIFINSGNLSRLFTLLKKKDVIVLVRWLNFSNNQHVTYVSMGLSLSIIFIVKFINNKKRIYLFFKVIAILINVFIIFIMGSRAALVVLFLLTGYYIFKYLRNKKKIVILISFGVLVLFFLFILQYSRFKENLGKIKEANNIVEVDFRFGLWSSAINVWENNPLFGTGIGSAKELLLNEYKAENNSVALKRKLNCHNQFLETATQTGLLGLINLLLVFAIPLYHAIKKKQELLFLFLTICFINFMFESMLQRLAGVVFFAFWYSFLWLAYYKDLDDTESIPAP